MENFDLKNAKRGRIQKMTVTTMTTTTTASETKAVA